MLVCLKEEALFLKFRLILSGFTLQGSGFSAAVKALKLESRLTAEFKNSVNTESGFEWDVGVY